MTAEATGYVGPAWWPLRMVRSAPRSRRVRDVVIVWLLASAVAIAFAIAEAHYDWSAIPVHLGRVTISVSIYPPLFITVLLALWLGPMWGVGPAYLSTLASALVSGMPLHLSALFALATPIEILIVWGSMAILGIHPDLREARDVGKFVGVAFLASIASSLAGLIWIDTHELDLVRGHRIWEGWVVGDYLQIGVALPLVLRGFGQRARAWVDRQFPVPPRYGIRYERSVAFVVLIVGIMTLLVFQGVQMLMASLRIPAGATTPDGESLLAHLREIVWFMGLLLLVATTTVSLLAAALARVSERERNVALRDQLTGCFNRRAFYALFQKEADRSRRLERGLSLIQFDIDHFKQINDTYGHETGDEVLRQVVQRTQNVMREHDLLFRWGGEEFVVLIPHTDPEDASQLAERVRVAIATEPFTPVDGSRPIAVTVSLGSVAAALPADPDELIGLADVACYLAKERGRNRVVSGSAELESERR